MADKFINDLPLLAAALTDEFEMQRPAGVEPGESGKVTLQDIVNQVPASTTAVWGQITGDIAQQSDLQVELDLKADDADLANYLPLSGGNLQGPLDIEAAYSCLTWSSPTGDVGYLQSTDDLVILANTAATDSEYVLMNSVAGVVNIGTSGVVRAEIGDSFVRFGYLAGAGTRDVQVLADGTLVAV